MRYFVIRGFGVKKDSAGASVDFDEVDAQLIAPALARCGYTGGTTGKIVEAGNIRADMFELILEADIVICDITVHNANVFYELGIRHALRKKHTVLIKGEPSSDVAPFDLSTDRYMAYPISNPGAAVDRLVDAIQSGVNGTRITDSPIFLMLPNLAEANTSDLCVVPIDFIEEVQRAEAASDRGWLRLIADELRGERFERDGLRVVARAQWSLKDLEGARASWEAVRDGRPSDPEANLALANIYERLYREGTQPVLLEYSNQAIRRVLDSEGLDASQRAEGLALRGRNLKTLWRLEFRELATLEERRARALDVKLLHSYEAYREAFQVDLNRFFPGIACLQAGVILKTLSSSPSWRNLFGRDAVKASRYREDLDRQLASLEHVVAASIAGALERAEGEDRMWAQISEADLLFLTEPEESLVKDASLVVDAYRAAIQENKRFAWDATRGQLLLFSSLGIRTIVADAVIAALDKPAKHDNKALHLIVVTGHTVDTPAAPRLRFPAAAEARAKAVIEERIRGHLREGEQLVVLASAAPGTDILAHEVCAQLGVQSVLCLPMPADVVAREVFSHYDTWLDRLFSLVRAKQKDLLALHDHAEVPRWLRNRKTDPWERGNRWVVKLAEAWGAKRVTLLALWDGDDAKESVGGTAHMIRLARQTGRFSIDVIDSRQFL